MENKIISAIRKTQIEIVEILEKLSSSPSEKSEWEKRRKELINKENLLNSIEIYISATYQNWMSDPRQNDTNRFKTLEKTIDEKKRVLLKILLAELTKNKTIEWEFESGIFLTKLDNFRVSMELDKNNAPTKINVRYTDTYQSLFLFPIRCNKKGSTKITNDEYSIRTSKTVDPIGVYDRTKLYKQMVYKIAEKMEWRPRQCDYQDYKEYIAFDDNLKISIKKGAGYYFLSVSVNNTKEKNLVLCIPEDNLYYPILKNLYRLAEKQADNHAKKNTT